MWTQRHYEWRYIYINVILFSDVRQRNVNTDDGDREPNIEIDVGKVKLKRNVSLVHGVSFIVGSIIGNVNSTSTLLHLHDTRWYSNRYVTFLNNRTLQMIEYKNIM